jgi:hypothetical protein
VIYAIGTSSNNFDCHRRRFISHQYLRYYYGCENKEYFELACNCCSYHLVTVLIFSGRSQFWGTDGVVLPAIAGIIFRVGKYWMKYFEVKTAKLESEKARIDEQRKHVDTEFGLKRLDRIITNVVSEAEQVKPSGIKPTLVENAERFSSVQTIVKSQITPETMAALATAVKDPERYITTKIESAVGDLKSTKTKDCIETVK